MASRRERLWRGQARLPKARVFLFLRGSLNRRVNEGVRLLPVRLSFQTRLNGSRKVGQRIRPDLPEVRRKWSFGGTKPVQTEHWPESRPTQSVFSSLQSFKSPGGQRYSNHIPDTGPSGLAAPFGPALTFSDESCHFGELPHHERKSPEKIPSLIRGAHDISQPG